MQVGQFATLFAVRVQVVADLQQALRLGVAECLQPEVLLLRQCGDVLTDVRIDALVDERNPGRVSDQPERGAVYESGVHGGAPFYGQAEPDLRLCTQGASVAAHVTRAGAVDRAERAPERLGGAVSVADGDAQQIVLTPDDVGSGDGHAASAYVLRQRHAGQGREHPAQVVFRRAEPTGQSADVELLSEVLFDEVDKLVECRDHEASFQGQPCRKNTGRTRPQRFDPIMRLGGHAADARSCPLGHQGGARRSSGAGVRPAPDHKLIARPCRCLMSLDLKCD